MADLATLQLSLDVPAAQLHALMTSRQDEITTAIKHQIARADIPALVEAFVVENLSGMIRRQVDEAIRLEVEQQVARFTADITDLVGKTLKAGGQ